MFLWLLQVVIVLVLISVVISLSLRPKPPSYTILGFTIPSSNTRNSTSITQNNTLIFIFEITNPNDGIGIYYDQANITFHRGDQVVGESSLASFYQGHKKNTRREVNVNGGEQLWKARLNGTVELKVGVVSEVRYIVLGRTTRRHRVDLEGEVGIRGDGKLVDGRGLVLNHSLAFPVYGV